MADLSNEKRAQIIALAEHAGKSSRQIASDLGLCQSTVSRIIKKYKETGSYESGHQNCGSVSKIDERGDRLIVRLSKKDPCSSSSYIAKELEEFHDIHVDSSTVRRHLLKEGRPAYRPILSQVLNVNMMKRRLAWCKAHRHWTVTDWARVMFSDESSFEIQPPGSQYVRRSYDETPSAPHFKSSFRHPVKVMIWSCISVKGTGRIHIVEGSMNTEQYLKVLQTRVIPQLNEWFPDGDGWFQQDLASCHTAKRCKDYLAANHISVLPWPGNSPDLSPIENIWALVKRKLRHKRFTTNVELINGILDIWARSDDFNETCINLVNSMPNRIEACIRAKGGSISY